MPSSTQCNNQGQLSSVFRNTERFALNGMPGAGPPLIVPSCGISQPKQQLAAQSMDLDATHTVNGSAELNRAGHDRARPGTQVSQPRRPASSR
ncbi:hypothetical protein ACVWY0_004199 [Arthrobacter sp. UYNi723]